MCRSNARSVPGVCRSLTVAALIVFCGRAWAQQAWKDQAEFDLYGAVAADIKAGNFAKEVADLDAWKQRYPGSDFKTDRELLYVKAYADAKQPAKAVDTAAPLLAGGAEAAFKNPADVINLLSFTAAAIQQIASPTAEELVAGGKAAAALATYDKMPAGMSEQAWAEARRQMQETAKAALLYVALVPGVQAFKKKDCAAAESVFKRALEDRPKNAQVAEYLAESELCLYANGSQPGHALAAIYELAVAADLDPAHRPRLEEIYRKFHGEDAEGLQRLLELARNSPFPPPGFAIQSVADIAREKQDKQDKFDQDHPELTLWLKIRAKLAGPDGEQYFMSDLKDSAVPPLAGVLVEAKPACRSTELRVAVPLPGFKPPFQAEIVLKIEKPLAGKPELESALRWEGVPVSFTANPLLLTIETDAGKIEGLKTSPCAAPGPKKNLSKGKQ